MNPPHEDIRELLPEYARAERLPEAVEAHIKACSECGHEFALLKSLVSDAAPKPGDLFFDTLPGRVSASLRRKKRVLSAFIPAFAVLAMAVTAGYLYVTLRSTPPAAGDFSGNPFAPQVYDFTDVSVEDIPLIGQEPEDDVIYASDVTPFLREFAYMSPEEIEALDEVLVRVINDGGAQ